MMSYHFKYNLGDLVEFLAGRNTEEYIDYERKVGIIIEQHYRITTDNRYKVKCDDRVHFVRCDDIKLLSSGNKNKT